MPSPESTSGQGGPNFVRHPTQFRVMTLHFIRSQQTQILTLKMEFWGTKTKCCKSSTGKLVEACSVQGFKQGRSVHWRSALLSLQEKVKQGETDVIPPRAPNVLSHRDREIKCEAFKHESANILLLHQPGRTSTSGRCMPQDCDSAKSEMPSCSNMTTWLMISVMSCEFRSTQQLIKENLRQMLYRI